MDEENKGTNGGEIVHRTPRARNRTVLLTSDMAGQVRSRLSAATNNPRETSFSEEASPFERPVVAPERPAIPERGPVEHSPIERRSEVPTPMPSFREPPAEVEDEIPSHLTRQRMEEAERASFKRPEPEMGRIEQRPMDRRPALTEPEPSLEEDRIVWSKEGALIGFLISYDKNENGTFFELRTGRLIITSEFAGTGNFLYLNDQSVSPMHAILRCNKGTPIQVLDQLSECGTKIIAKGSEETKELAGDKGVLNHGDTVYFGERSFKVCLIDE